MPPAGDGQFVRLLSTQRLCRGGSELVVRVAGNVDVTTVPTLAEGFDRARHQVRAVDDGLGIVADLRAVGFLGVAGLWALVRAREACLGDGLDLRVVAEHAAVVSPLTLTGLDRVLNLRSGTGMGPG
ncbi:MAG: STAS domain-containing protein [Actinophytocola sp.]|uniref:STAS domain-containing protein n=1 Tax=Actinophytocola sp. TaxID=1872138 RepID=UPI003C743573